MGRGFDSGWVGAGADDDLDRRLAAETEPFDLTRPHVMTALGPIEPAALGVTILSSLLATALPTAVGVDGAAGHLDSVLAELEDAHYVGVRALLDPSAARDPAAAAWVAARAPTHLVLVAEAGPDRPAAALVREGTDGIGGTTSRAGAIGVGETGDDDRTGGTARLRAAAAQAATGLPVVAEAPAVPGSGAVPILAAAGIEVGRVVVIHRRWRDGAVWGDLEGGAFVALAASVPGAAPAAGGAGPDGGRQRELAEAIAALVRGGYGERLLLAAEPAGATALRASGGLGIAAVPERLPLAMMEAGLDASAVRRLLVDNPARALTIGTGAG